ncbi:MAG: C25 family cysteine peptidase, partial [Acidobacteriota bacterium]
VDGIPHFAWSTASQAGTVGFEVLRSEAGDWRPVHRELVPATVAPARRADYRVADPGVPPAGVSRYLIVERDGQGRRIQHGPFSVRLDVARRAAADDAEWPLDRQVIPPAPSGGPEFEGRPKTLNLVGITGAAAYHLEIEQTGWYRLSAEALGELFGADSRRARRWIRNGQLALETSGESVAWTSDVGSTGLIFFGEGPESLPSAWAEVAPANAYRLTQTPGLVSSTANARPRSGARPPQTYLDVLEFEQQVFPGTVAAQDPEDDFWFWAGVAAGTSHDTAAVAFDVPNLATEGTSSLTVRLHGANRTGRTFDHRVEMTLNGNRLGTVSWAGFSHREAHFEIDSSWLLETGNTLQLQAQVVTDGEPSFVYLDGFSLKTHRLLEVHDPEQALRIDVTSARQVLEIGEVPDADTWVFDTRDPKRPVLQTADVVPAAGGLALRFQPRRRGSFWVVPSTALRTPAAIRPWRAPSLPLSSPTRRADLLLVTADALRPSADDWANYRRADGLEVEVLDLAQIEDSLTHGVRTPHAVRTLLAHAASWQLPPRFVLLLGDGHFDTQDHWGFGGNLIPPPLIRTDAGLYASDRWFLPVGPDAPSIGRLPATSNAQVRAALDKVKAFERQGRNLAALAVADNADAGGSFAADAENLLTLLPDGWQTRSIDLGAQSLGELRGDLLNAFGENLTWLQFFGHGGVDRFASEGILTTEDVATLPMGPTFPLVTALTCNAGRFELPGVASLAGELTLVPDRGAAAVLAPSALAFHSNSAAFGRLLTEALFQKPSAPKRLGEAQQQAERRFLQAGGSPDHLEVLHLFGDPAMRLPQ